MELGEKLRAARLEAGLSQRALCGDEITRNMLSQIENGTAQPSMKTLRYLSSRLGKSMSYFLEESMPASPNAQRILLARRCYDLGDWMGTIRQLKEYKVPDPVFDRERDLLWSFSSLALAEEALREKKAPYARELLEQVVVPVYAGREILRQKLLLLGRLRGERVSSRLPSLDEELMLRSREALEDEDYPRAMALMDAVENRNPEYHLLRGQLCYSQEDYREAAEHLQQAEALYPKETVPQLEACFRELGDFEKAYLYACKARR